MIIETHGNNQNPIFYFTEKMFPNQGLSNFVNFPIAVS